MLIKPIFKRIGFIAESKSRIVIAFRGTVNLGDLRKGISAAQTPFPYYRSRHRGLTHKGYTELYRAIRPSIMEALRKSRSRKPVCLTDHRLGGALAAMCALDLSFFRPGRVRLFTYASPKVGDPTFAAAIRKRVKAGFRIYNTKDIVPGLPPRSFLAYRYEHAGSPVPITFNRSNPLSNHSMAAYVRALYRESGGSCET